jgi:small subunit ribosomal protein S3
MGRKVHPKGFRLIVDTSWVSKWFTTRSSYKDLLHEDIVLRKALIDRLRSSGIAQVQIERSINKMKITLHVSKPGVVIGRGGSGLEILKKFIESTIAYHRKNVRKNKNRVLPKDDVKEKIEISVEPVKEPNLNAFLVATNISDQIVKRMPHKRVCNQAIERVMSAGALGVRIILAGRIRGAEIARRERFQEGMMPLSTIRDRIEYASTPALTKSGYVGVKVWIARK